MKGHHVIVEQLNVFMTQKIKMKETVHPFLNSHIVVEPQNDILFDTSL